MPQKSSRRRIALAADHGGRKLKDLLRDHLRRRGERVEDLGTDSDASVDYPDFAARLARLIQARRCDLGILVCGTGIGMSITANRFAGVRAALCTSGFTARMARAHNDANVLCLGERVTGPGEAIDILEAFLATSFEGGRHARRVRKIRALAGGRRKSP
jgi:ribose 5-phosphate isomerase B